MSWNYILRIHREILLNLVLANFEEDACYSMDEHYVCLRFQVLGAYVLKETWQCDHIGGVKTKRTICSTCVWSQHHMQFWCWCQTLRTTHTVVRWVVEHHLSWTYKTMRICVVTTTSKVYHNDGIRSETESLKRTCEPDVVTVATHEFADTPYRCDSSVVCKNNKVLYCNNYIQLRQHQFRWYSFGL